MNRKTFNKTIAAFMDRRPYRAFTLVMVSGDRFEVDHGRALALGDGAAVLIAPGNVPVFFDNEGVSEIIGDLSSRGRGKKRHDR